MSQKWRDNNFTAKFSVLNAEQFQRTFVNIKLSYKIKIDWCLQTLWRLKNAKYFVFEKKIYLRLKRTKNANKILS